MAPLDNDPASGLSAAQRNVGGANARVVDDWLAAIEAGESRFAVATRHEALEMAWRSSPPG